MPAKASDVPPPLRRLLENGPVSFARFMDVVLYDPEYGYYCVARRRVAKSKDADFYTSTSVGRVFTELVMTACRTLLGDDACASHTFVEVGAEPGESLLGGTAHPFAGAQTCRHGDQVRLPQKTILFSNELFDARPFHRLVAENDCWVEKGVALEDGMLAEITLPSLSPEAAALQEHLPEPAVNGYRFDAPLDAVRVLEELASGEWTGLFLAFDYGKSWEELVFETPGGTARAYHRHKQETDLLARPGKQDLTCHICWDWMEATLRRFRFSDVQTTRQEAFFVKHSLPAIERIFAAPRKGIDPDRQSLAQLIHPAHMGQQFQVLTAIRTE